MENYQVYYKDILIGMLSIDGDYRYCYKPEFENVEKIKDSACLLRVMKEGTDGFEEPIPFFQERIRYMKLWKLGVINYQTDNFVIKKISE